MSLLCELRISYTLVLLCYILYFANRNIDLSN